MQKKSHKTDYNIEYAHIYTDESFDINQRDSIKKLEEIINNLDKEKKDFTLTILIDDYNPTSNTLNINNFLKEVEKYGHKPDFIFLESKLVKDKEMLLKEMKDKERREYEKYINKKNKIPCSFLIAIWYLKRLGVISINKNELEQLNKNNKAFIAKKIITILPQKYKSVEIKAQEIIKLTKFKKRLKDIEIIYF